MVFASTSQMNPSVFQKLPEKPCLWSVKLTWCCVISELARIDSLWLRHVKFPQHGHIFEQILVGGRNATLARQAFKDQLFVNRYNQSFFDEYGDPQQLQTRRFLGREVMMRFVSDVTTARGMQIIPDIAVEVSIVSVLVTPQPATHPDVITILMVTFTYSQYGSVSAEYTLKSITQTPDGWFVLWGLAVFGNVQFFISTVYECHRTA